MLTVTRNNFLKRLDSLPESIRAFAFSIEIGDILRSIAQAHHLDSVKSNQVLALTAAVFFGFVHRTDFAKEIAETIKIDMKIADSIADEIGRKVFAQIQAELDRFYRPTLTSAEQESATATPSEKGEEPEFSAPVFLRPRSTPSAPSIPSAPTKGSATTPFVLHEEKPITEEIKKETMKGFSLPFGLFKSKAGESTLTPRVTVEAPKRGPEPQKTVHYSEYRSNIAPGSGGEFINLETFGKTRIDADKTDKADTSNIPIKKVEAPIATLPPQVPSTGTGTPKVEGNMVDLR